PLEAPHVLFSTVTHRRIFERHRETLRSSFVLERFGLERGPQWRGEATPAATSELREVAFERLDADVGVGRISILRRQQNPLGVHDHANGARLAVGRSGVLNNLGYLGGDQVTVSEGASEFEVQLWKAQRQT